MRKKNNKLHKRFKSLFGTIIISSVIGTLVFQADNRSVSKEIELSDKQIYKVGKEGEADLYCGDGTGTGFFIDKETIITNDHVIKPCLDKKTMVTVKTLHGDTTATVIKHNAAKDLAILKVNTIVNNIKPLRIAKTDVEIADTVYSIGNKAGLNHSFHKGIVQSYLAKTEVALVGSDMMNSFGGSGSAVLNTKGEVVGVITMIAPKFYITIHIKLNELKEFIGYKNDYIGG